MESVLNSFISSPWFYILLFAIIFCEIGVVLGILFPGDSLLFTVGMLSAATSININFAVLAIVLGAILGDLCNYITGKFVGERIFKPNARFLKTAYLNKTKSLLEQYGARALIFSRFIAFVRTLTPFVAGMCGMNYIKFAIFGVISAIIWAFSITYTVYFFSKNAFVKSNFSYIISFIVILVIAQILVKPVINKIRRKKA